jgi:hypothetical protein
MEEISENLQNKDFQCCKKECGSKFSHQQFAEIRQNVNKMNFEARNAFICACINTEDPKKRKFYLATKSVCRNYFLLTLNITMNLIRRALDKWNKSDLKDKRGLHGNYISLSENQRHAVIDHIRSFPVYVSHYKREASTALYLDSSLNLSLMHRLLKEKWNEVSKVPDDSPPSYTFYSQIFHTIGYKFKPLKSDTCKDCDGLKQKIQIAKDENEKLKFQSELSEHQDKASRASSELENDLKRVKGDKSVRVMIFDLQKVLILPKAPTNVFFYSRNVNTYNLNVHESGNGTFHYWTEVDGGRGAREVASCLINYLESTLKTDTEELIFWSDSCGGQNRNHIVAIMMLHFLCSGKHPHIKKISFKFFVSGHSFNACDRDFAIFENLIKRTQIICTPMEYVDLMLKCKTKNPFKVTIMTHDMFLDPANLLKNITKRDCDRISKDQVYWIKSRELKLVVEKPFSLFLRYSFDGDFHELNYAKLKRTSKSEKISSTPWKDMSFTKLYAVKKKLSDAKKRDLMKVRQYLPLNGRQYLEEIINAESENFVDDIDGYSAEDFEELPEI